MGDYNTQPKEKTKEEEIEEQKALLRAQARNMNQLVEVQKNEELAQMYNDNAKLGSENTNGELPLLKVHTQGKSSTNELADGREPKDGSFFYKPTLEEFEEINCHILTISRGYRAPSQEDPKKLKFNQIVGGVIVDGGEYKPFIMYMSGLKLQPMWDFGKEANKYTHAKPVAIPMFALLVKLTTRSEKNTMGKSWLIDFDIVRSEDGNPVLITDPGKFQYIKDNVEMVKGTIEQIIAAKEVKANGLVENDIPLPEEE